MKSKGLLAILIAVSLNGTSRAAVSTAVGPMPNELAVEFTKQINSELSAAYVYLGMATHFGQKNLEGFSRWFTSQFYEELNHARKMIRYMNDKGADVSFPAISEVKAAYERPVDAFLAGLDHEEKQTAKIHALFEKARVMRAYDAETFLKYFVDEQVEEEANFNAVVDKLKLIGGSSPEGLLALDRELGSRALPKIE